MCLSKPDVACARAFLQNGSTFIFDVMLLNSWRHRKGFVTPLKDIVASDAPKCFQRHSGKFSKTVRLDFFSRPLIHTCAQFCKNAPDVGLSAEGSSTTSGSVVVENCRGRSTCKVLLVDLRESSTREFEASRFIVFLDFLLTLCLLFSF